MSPESPATKFLLGVGLATLFFGCFHFSSAQQSSSGPIALQIDNLPTPLGIDDPAPLFSWQLQDPARNAVQTAYQIQVASSPELLSQRQPDVWDSGQVKSAQSLNVKYAGPALKPSTRYYWRVLLSDAAGKPYPASAVTWWETGLMSQDAWRAQWIGYETPEESAVRNADSEWITSPDRKALAQEKQKEQRIAYRTIVKLDQPARSAILFATGQDTVSAWVNGAEVLKAQPLPPYGQMPWKKFVRASVHQQIKPGANTIAIEAMHYVANPSGQIADDAPPMMATLVVEYEDGTWASFGSDAKWKTSIQPPQNWQQAGFDDSAWKPAVGFTPASAANDPDVIREKASTMGVVFG